MITCKNCLISFHVKPSKLATHNIQFCSKECRLEFFDRNYVEILLERFLSLTHKEMQPTSPYVDTPCWIWKGNVDKHGYGYLTVMKPAKHKEHAPRISMLLFKPDENIRGLHTCHLCHNKLCVNPEHIHAGTSAVNISEMVETKRQAWGEELPQAKLTEEDVRAIRVSLADGVTKYALAKKFNVTWNTIYNVDCGKTWKHLI